MSRIIKKGDTLIEVLIAFAIFSAIATAIVGASRANVATIQTSLEDTVAQAEIDSQAEALRFIQESYQTDSANPFYAGLWNRILGQVNKNTDVDISRIQEDYTSIDAPYDPENEANIYNYNAFLINTRLLSNYDSYLQACTSIAALFGLGTCSPDALMDQIVIPSSSPNTTFTSAPTVPKLLYSQTIGGTSIDSESLATNISTTDIFLTRAEGIWIIAVYGENDNFIDFYIRTCWDGPKSSTPDKISTTIRLADSSNIAFSDPISHNNINITFHYKTGAGTKEFFTYEAQGVAKRGGTVEVKLDFPVSESEIYTRNGLDTFVGWKRGEKEHEDDTDYPPNWEASYYEEDYYCAEAGGYCTGKASITFGSGEFNTLKEIHLYATTKPKMVILFLVDLSGSMQDDMEQITPTLKKLSEAVTAAKGYALYYTVGGIPEFHNYCPENPFTSSSSWQTHGPKDKGGNCAADDGLYELTYDSSIRYWVVSRGLGKNYCANSDVITQGLHEVGNLSSIVFIGRNNYDNGRGQYMFNDSTPETCSIYFIDHLAKTVLSDSKYAENIKAVIYLTDTNGRNTSTEKYSYTDSNPSRGHSMNIDSMLNSLHSEDITFYTITDGGHDWNAKGDYHFLFKDTAVKLLDFDQNGKITLKDK